MSRMKTQRLLMFLVVLALPLATSGCSWFRTACEKAIPVLSTGQNYVVDGGLALDQAQAYAATLPAGVLKTQLLAAIYDGRSALRAASYTLDGLISACTTQDPLVVLGDFVAAWAEVRKIIAAVAGIVGSPGAPVQLPVSDPQIYRVAVARWLK